MQKTWFTSDLHFFHDNILKFCPRRNAHLYGRTHNDMLIDIWNSQVDDNDIVYNLGDFSMGNSKETISVLKQLKGKHILIRGNHEKYLKDPTTHNYFEEIYDYHEINYSRINRKICMFHFPIYEWNAIHYGAYMLHGHVHQKTVPVDGRILNVGIDAHPEFRLFSMDEVIELLEPKEIRKHH